MLQDANFTLKYLSGGAWTLKDLRGAVVFVNFWATWCPPCRKDMPDLDALHKRYRKSGLVFLSIFDEPDAKAKSHLADENYKYPILLDPSQKTLEAFVLEYYPQVIRRQSGGLAYGPGAEYADAGAILADVARSGVEMRSTLVDLDLERLSRYHLPIFNCCPAAGTIGNDHGLS